MGILYLYLKNERKTASESTYMVGLRGALHPCVELAQSLGEANSNCVIYLYCTYCVLINSIFIVLINSTIIKGLHPAALLPHEVSIQI